LNEVLGDLSADLDSTARHCVGRLDHVFTKRLSMVSSVNK
jgi:hypothetical protein